VVIGVEIDWIWHLGMGMLFISSNFSSRSDSVRWLCDDCISFYIFEVALNSVPVLFRQMPYVESNRFQQRIALQVQVLQTLQLQLYTF